MHEALTSLDVTLTAGSASSGKTRSICNAIKELASEGTEAADILVIAPTAPAKATLRQRIADALENIPKAALDADALRILTPSELAHDILSTPEAKMATGRVPRMLLPFEETMLVEDLKTIGTKPRRLREMVRFIFKSMTEELTEADWVESGEERCVYDKMQECLRFYQGMLRYELPGVAQRFLAEHPDAARNHGALHVLVDDAHLLGRTSQRLAWELAAQTLCMAGDEAGAPEAAEPYPYAGWLKDAQGSFPDAETIELAPASSCEGAARLRDLRHLPQPEEFLPAARIRERAEASRAAAEAQGVHVMEGATPDEEFALVAAFAQELVDGGACAPERIFIATPHRQWTSGITRALRDAGLPACNLPERRMLSTDTRDMRRSAFARAVTLLALIADPEDGVSWRAWCGFGLPTGAAGGFKAMMDSQAYHSLTDALSTDDLARCPVPRETELSTAQDLLTITDLVSAARRVIAKFSGLRGTVLLETLARTTSGGDAEVEEATRRNLMTLCAGFGESIDSQDTAAALIARAFERMDHPRFEDEGAVRVGGFADQFGEDLDVIVLSGFVDGLIVDGRYFDPDFMEKKDRNWDDAVEKVRIAGARPIKQLAISYFSSIDVERAGSLKLEVERIRSVGQHKRIARTLPSVLLTAFLPIEDGEQAS